MSYPKVSKAALRSCRVEDVFIDGINKRFRVTSRKLEHLKTSHVLHQDTPRVRITLG